MGESPEDPRSEYKTSPRLPTQSVELVLLVDVSASMLTNGKIQSLNVAVQESLPSIRRSVVTTPGLEVAVRALSFGSDIKWFVSTPVRIEEFIWPDVEASPGGLSELGLALSAVTKSMNGDGSNRRDAQSLILFSDGMATDTRHPTFDVALGALNDHPKGRLGSRVAVAVGTDADTEMLETFVKPVNGSVLTAHNPNQLASKIRLAGETVISGASESIW